MCVCVCVCVWGGVGWGGGGGHPKRRSGKMSEVDDDAPIPPVFVSEPLSNIMQVEWFLA